MNRVTSAVKRALHVLTIFLFVSASALAGVDDEEKRTVIYFANGVGNGPALTSKNALTSLVALMSQKEALELKHSGTYSFKLAYNASRGLQDDLREVYLQKVLEHGHEQKKAEDYYNAILQQTARSHFKISDLQEYEDEYLDALILLFLREVEVEKYIDLFKSDLKEGKRVIVIAHSQGNLFANEAIFTIWQHYPEWKKSIGVIGVGSAASIAPNDLYVTANDDLVIGALRAKLGALNGNIDNNVGIQRDPFSHEFLQSYYKKGLPSYDKINEYIDLLSTNLEFSPLSENNFEIENLSFPEITEIALSKETRKDVLSISWSGDAAFPLTAYIDPAVCSDGWECPPEMVTIGEDVSSPFSHQWGCWSVDGDTSDNSGLITYAVTLIDAAGLTTPAKEFSYTCAPPITKKHSGTFRHLLNGLTTSVIAQYNLEDATYTKFRDVSKTLVGTMSSAYGGNIYTSYVSKIFEVAVATGEVTTYLDSIDEQDQLDDDHLIFGFQTAAGASGVYTLAFASYNIGIPYSLAKITPGVSGYEKIDLSINANGHVVQGEPYRSFIKGMDFDTNGKLYGLVTFADVEFVNLNASAYIAEIDPASGSVTLVHDVTGAFRSLTAPQGYDIGLDDDIVEMLARIQWLQFVEVLNGYMYVGIPVGLTNEKTTVLAINLLTGNPEVVIASGVVVE